MPTLEGGGAGAESKKSPTIRLFPTPAPTHPTPSTTPQAVLDAGVTVISVGHRPTLVRYHRRVLQLGPSQGPTVGASWSVCTAEEFAGAAAAASGPGWA